MAAKRGKSQARRNSGGGGGGGMPGWAWLVLGVALTIGGVLLAPQLLNLGGGDGGFFRAQPTPNPDAKPAGGRDDEALAGEAPPPDAKPVQPPPKEQEYSFYNVLSGEETALSDEELAARAQAEASAPPPTPPAPKPPVEDVPKPLETTATPTPAPTPPQQTASGSPDKDAGSDPGKQDDDARYILQAGAFAASGDAEALKAKIAFLGLSARVESAQLQGKTMYRVRMGPYGSASELAEAKRKLANGGLPALAIRSR